MYTTKAAKAGISFLGQHGVDAPPIDVAGLAKAEGLGVVVEPNCPDASVLGALYVSEGAAAVAVSGDWAAEDQRFAVAHLLGHWVLRHQIKGAFICRGSRSVDARDSASGKLCLAASRFAMEVLMPRAQLEMVAPTESVADLAAEFGVAELAMAVRLWELGLRDPV